MDLSYPPEAEALREEVRAWLLANLPEGWGEPGFATSPDERRRFNEEWTAKLREEAGSAPAGQPPTAAEVSRSSNRSC